MSRRAAAAWLALLLAPIALACERPVSRPHLALVLVDTLRADHLGAYGYTRPTSPRIDALAAGGVVFDHARSPSSWTKPAVASLFTSRLPSEHGVVRFDRPLGDELPTLAAALASAGYRTVGASANPVHVSRETGLARGFDDWTSLMLRGPGEAGPPRSPTAAELNDRLLPALPEAGEGPVFLYVHYIDPHAPYDPPRRHLARFLRDPAAHRRAPAATLEYSVDLAAGRATAGPGERERLVDLYDAEIAGVDEAIGRLVDELRRRWGDDLVVVVTADHGEEFLDHDGWTHGLTLHRECLAVPLVVRDFREPARAVRREDPVDLLDVPTTLLALAGLPAAPGMRGRDLLAPGPLPARDLVAELHPDARFEDFVALRSHDAALLRWPWKLIVPREGEPQLYRVDRDPAERDALAEGEEAPARELADALATLRADAAPVRTDRVPAPLAPEQLEGLRALGYVE